MSASLILAIIKAIPAARDLFFKVIDLFYAEMDRRMENESAKVLKEREALVASLKLDGLTAENRSVIRRRLYELQSN